MPTGPSGKFDPGGCAGNTASGNPRIYPPTCQWKLYAAQSFDLVNAEAGRGASGRRTVLTKTPMHIGDICNLGIFCVDPNSNRHLLDFISETVDPTTGYAHIAYADDNTVKKLRVANQVSGPSIIGRRYETASRDGPAPFHDLIQTRPWPKSWSSTTFRV